MILSESSIRKIIKRLIEITDTTARVSSLNFGSPGGESSEDGSESGSDANIKAIKGNYPKENVKAVIDALKREGFTNDNAIMGILSVIAKESGFVPKNEVGYKNTSISRIKEVFGKNTIRVNIDDIKSGTKFSNLSDDQISKLKASNEKFFNALYGGRIGNNDSGDGWKFRGRGFNQLTGRSNYRKAGYENNPDAVNNVKDAAIVVAKFFKNFHNDVWSFQQLNSAKTPEEGANMAADKNGGMKNKTRARRHTMERLPQFKEMFKKDKSSS